MGASSPHFDIGVYRWAAGWDENDLCGSRWGGGIRMHSYPILNRYRWLYI